MTPTTVSTFTATTRPTMTGDAALRALVELQARVAVGATWADIEAHAAAVGLDLGELERALQALE